MHLRALTLILVAVCAAPASAAASPRCHTGDLYVSLRSTDGAAGHVLYVFRARNMSGRTCHTTGFFGVRLLGKRGRELPTRGKRVTTDYFGDQRKQRVTLRAGQSGSFRISTSIGSGTHCVKATSLRLGAPNDKRRVTVLLGKQTLSACDRGKIFVSPVQAGDGAKAG